ncbi:hypothetical protein ERJ75_000528900 [Trypanosoma vivax]|nr:hypothetical protein ERJ75_001626600 [Trypanosoma vivax]KAH8605345.1 hypothetical protein ERJ75_001625800 [Trypanosoma vivax]KAH8615828.1 hypothetical protein ERJ75_000545100 [Trypanosoma vivax]KAH8615950.1 hypothetical protein ERJ75_000528900 [Trypanosoma vivax]
MIRLLRSSLTLLKCVEKVVLSGAGALIVEKCKLLREEPNILSTMSSTFKLLQQLRLSNCVSCTAASLCAENAEVAEALSVSKSAMTCVRNASSL